MIKLYTVKPEEISTFCESEAENTTGPINELMLETKQYIQNIDQALSDSVGA